MFLKKISLSKKRGMTLVETLVGLAIFVLVFTSLFAGVRLGVSVIANNKAKTGALALLNERMELVRSIPYDTLGTVYGIPAGTLDQSTTTRLNVTNYTIKTLIKFVDMPQDGLGGADGNGITTDIKQAKVEVTWADRGIPRSLFMVTDIAPKGEESVIGGGTLRINVFDALANPLPGAQVHVENLSLVPPVDVTTFSTALGVVSFPGAPSGNSYKVTVTKNLHSTDGTYEADAGNPNPAPGHFTIAADQTTSGSFFIDAVSTLIVRTFLPILPGLFTDIFANSSNIASLIDTEVAGGGVILGPDTIDYLPSGSVLSITVLPSSLNAWDQVSWSHTVPVDTAIVVQVMQVSSGGVVALVPDADLPWNSVGFSSSPISLATLDPGVYPRLALKALLSTADVAITPSLDEWALSYFAGPTPLPNIPFSINGAKVIGTTGLGLPIYKYSATGNTGAGSSQTFSNMEWDTYQISQDPVVTTYNVMESCSPQPVSLSPGVTMYADLTLTPATADSILLTIKSSVGALLSGATVTLTRPGFSEQKTSSACGQVYFGGLSGLTYTVEAGLGGYQTASMSIDVSGSTLGSLTLSP